MSGTSNPWGEDIADLKATVLRLTAQIDGIQATIEALRETSPAPEPGARLAPLSGGRDRDPDAHNGNHWSAEESRSSDGETAGQEMEIRSPPFILFLPDGIYEEELAAMAVWVEGILIPIYGQEVSQNAPWCPLWWKHSEAIARFHACWLAWQGLTDPRTGGVTGPAVWHRDYLDPMLTQLRSPQGPFAACMSNPDIEHHQVLPIPKYSPYPKAPPDQL